MSADNLHSGHRQRLKDRLFLGDFDNAYDHELLEFLLFTPIPRADTNPIAHRLIDAFGSLSGVLEASKEELKKIEGVGEKIAAFLASLQDVYRIVALSLRRETRTKMSSTEELISFYKPLFIGREEERFYLSSIDNSGRLIKNTEMARGERTTATIDTKQVIAEAVHNKATVVALCHNHPSSMALPSSADITMTRVLRDLLEDLGIVLLDHIIIGKHGDAFSITTSNALSDKPLKSSPLISNISELKAASTPMIDE